MKKEILDKAMQIINNIKGIEKEEYFFLLASFVMYFKSPLSREKWNTFHSKVENSKINLEDAVFMTDEEKNPEFFNDPKITKKYKTEVKNTLFQNLLETKNKLSLKYKFQNKTDTILIPDIINPNEFTVFPKMYIEKMINEGERINELTGHPFSWEVVESIKSNTPILKYTSKKISAETMMSQIKDEITKLQKMTSRCIMCKSPNINHKSLHESQCIYFCTLNCMKKWDS